MSKAVASIETTLRGDFEALSKEGKREVLNFLRFLRLKEELEATREILDDRSILESFWRGKKDFEKGRFRRWVQVKEDA